MRAINWDAHGKALSRLSNRRIQLIKMCNEILPTASITSRYDPNASPVCPICKAEDEDRDHVMRCADTTKAKLRQHFISSVQKRCTEMKTREMLTTILTDGLTQWFNDKELAPTDYPPLFRLLIQQQNELGWRQLFNGRFVSEWQRLQNQHLRTNGIQEITLTGQSWTTSMIVLLWKEFFDIWGQRNDQVHGNDKRTTDTAKRSKTVSHIKYLHTKTPEVLAAHRSIMFMRTHEDTTHESNGHEDTALDDILQTKTTNYLQNWVNTWKPAIEASIKAARALSVNTMGRMDEHFSYLVPPPKRPP